MLVSNWFKEWNTIYIGNEHRYLQRLAFSTIEELDRVVKQYEAECWEGTIFFTNDEKLFFRNLDQATRKKYCYGWKEVSEDRYWDMLECLPPQAHRRFKGWNIFRMSEYTTGDITTHFMELDWKFYEGSFDTSEYKDILDSKDLSYGK